MVRDSILRRGLLYGKEKGVWSAFLATSCKIVLQENIGRISRFQCFTKNVYEPAHCHANVHQGVRKTTYESR